MAINILTIMRHFRFVRVARYLKASKPGVLDVGCAGLSVRITKAAIPDCVYHGVDIAMPAPEMLALMERFSQIDISTLHFDDLPNEGYDLVVLSHVIEHIENGLEVIAELALKLRPGGVMYLEFPSVRSLSLSGGDGTIQFCDDPTHVRLYGVMEVANALLAAGLRVPEGGRRRDWRMIVLSFVGMPIQAWSLLTRGRLTARAGIWDLLGFSDYVIGIRPIETAMCLHEVKAPRVAGT